MSLANAEMKLWLPITKEPVDELIAHITDIDYNCVRHREKEVRRDVMAHVYQLLEPNSLLTENKV